MLNPDILKTKVLILYNVILLGAGSCLVLLRVDISDIDVGPSLDKKSYFRLVDQIIPQLLEHNNPDFLVW